MGQKVNPNGFRTGITKEWKVCWFSNKKTRDRYKSKCTDRHIAKYFKRYDSLLTGLSCGRNYTYRELVGISSKVRFFLDKFRFEGKNSGRKNISEIQMVYSLGYFIVYIKCYNSGIVVGERGSNVNRLTDVLEKLCKCQMQINVLKSGLGGAAFLSLNIQNRIRSGESYKKVLKSALSLRNSSNMGMKFVISGRLGGAEIARRDKFSIGRIPAHTLRSNIDYSHCDINTTYGIIGLKVWVYKGDIYKKPKVLLTTDIKNESNNRGRR